MSTGYYSEISQISHQVIQRRDFSSSAALNILDITKEETGSVFTFKQPTEWQERWFLSSNAKDIGTLYLMFALFSGLIGTAFSVLNKIRIIRTRSTIYFR